MVFPGQGFTGALGAVFQKRPGLRVGRPRQEVGCVPYWPSGFQQVTAVPRGNSFLGRSGREE